MSNILVSGLINLETTLQVDGFPIHYQPVRYPFFGVRSAVSGVGYNVAKALTTLGDKVHFLSLVGEDTAGQLVRRALAEDNIPGSYVLPRLTQTAQSVIFFDPDGRRMINVDLKDNQKQTYPPELFAAALADCTLAALCNVNFSRPMLKEARRLGKTIATDVHTLSDLFDEYNADFMRAAHVLFMSDEYLPEPPEAFARRVQNHYGNEIVVIGLGAAGALLSVKKDNFQERIPAAQTREVVNTIGAGDALFSSFIHFYAQTGDPYAAIQRAIIFASYKIGETGAAEGFLTEEGIEEWRQRAD